MATKIIVIPPTEERDAYIQVYTWTKPDGGPWVALKDKQSNTIFAWRHYFPHPREAEENVGICPPPAPSLSVDGGVTWTPLNGIDEGQWVAYLKGDTFYRWTLRRERGILFARKSK